MYVIYTINYTTEATIKSLSLTITIFFPSFSNQKSFEETYKNQEVA